MTDDEQTDVDPFDQLRERVMNLTGLEQRQASMVAADLYSSGGEDAIVSVTDILASCERLGYEVKAPAQSKDEQFTAALGGEITVDPAKVVTEVYEWMPRVWCTQIPSIGRAPAEAQQLAQEWIDQLPEEIRVLLVKIDVFEGKATFWLHDEANSIDRPIGPIDLTRYSDESAMQEAFMALLRRVRKVLAADYN